MGFELASVSLLAGSQRSPFSKRASFDFENVLQNQGVKPGRRTWSVFLERPADAVPPQRIRIDEATICQSDLGPPRLEVVDPVVELADGDDNAQLSFGVKNTGGREANKAGLVLLGEGIEVAAEPPVIPRLAPGAATNVDTSVTYDEAAVEGGAVVSTTLSRPQDGARVEFRAVEKTNDLYWTGLIAGLVLAITGGALWLKQARNPRKEKHP